MAGIQATRRTLGLRPVGSSHRVPPNDTARLMYYLRCVTLGLGMDILADRLIEDDHWARLSASDVDAVYLLALELSPDEFLNKALFHDADGTFVGDSNNKFYEAEAVTERVTVTSAFTLRGTSTTASKVMFFRNAWLDTFYLAPMRRGAARLTRIAAGIADAGHCRHCKGGAGACACTDGCRRQPDSRCAPTLASLLSALSVGLGAAAAPRPAAARPAATGDGSGAAGGAGARPAPRLGCRTGERRRVVGTSRADLNGATVVVADPVAGNGRAEVVFPSGEHRNVRFEHLAPIVEDLD